MQSSLAVGQQQHRARRRARRRRAARWRRRSRSVVRADASSRLSASSAAVRRSRCRAASACARTRCVSVLMTSAVSSITANVTRYCWSDDGEACSTAGRSRSRTPPPTAPTRASPPRGCGAWRPTARRAGTASGCSRSRRASVVVQRPADRRRHAATIATARA